MNNFQALIGLLNKARGKRTYTIVATLVGYIVICDFTGRPVNGHVVDVLTGLALATFRAALPEKTK